MGWWGYGVMEGDVPSDYACTIEDAFAVNLDRNNEGDLTEASAKQYVVRFKDAAFVQTVVNQAPQLIELWDEANIFWQVLGYMVMEMGGPIDSFKDKLVEAINNDDTSFRDGDLRQQKMDEFLEAVNKYDGQPVKLNQAGGLLDAVLDHFSQGKDGLVNK